jgi:Ca2+-transporting ATPase
MTTDVEQGLSARDASERLRADGYNELPSARGSGLLRAVLEILREPMFLLLLGCGGIYLLVGDAHEALILLGFVVLVSVITLYQEHRTERTLAALRDLSSPRALVLRDGLRQRIPGREVVRGDVLVLSEGDRVPADAALVNCLNLCTDESLLTGESVPVRKTVWDHVTPIGPPIGEGFPFVYAGTLVTRGDGVAIVQATGVRTEMGRIGKALAATVTERSPLQRETGALVRRLAVIGGALCVAVVLGYGLSRNDWLRGLLAGLTLAMAILPNEFPAVLAIFLALGAWRIAQRRVLTRRVPALETLGAATVLCVDKTGTLTLNQMTVRKLFADDRFFDVPSEPSAPLPEQFHELVEFGVLASQRDPFDPMEKAFTVLCETWLAGSEHQHPDWELVRQYPLRDELLALSHVWRSPDGRETLIAAKGAPEAIADLCHLPPEAQAALRDRVVGMAKEGLRVIGVARANIPPDGLPSEQHDFVFRLVGLAGLADPVRATVPDAVRECAGAGIRVVMITGDHPDTARSIARQIGLGGDGDVVTGAELDRLSDAELRARVGSVRVFARVVPEQKLRIVQTLKAAGEVVAMTGDGVNDAPALKAADIGIAMGGRGTDVAREAAALVLLDDDFASIVHAVRLGRRVFDNLRNAMAYVLAVHVPIAGISIVPAVFGLPLVLFPVHVAFLHLVIEPACSVVFEGETEDPDVMRRRPRSPSEGLFGVALLRLSLLRGTSVLVTLLTLFLVAIARGQGEADARTLTFTTLIVANLALILVYRSSTRSVLETIRAPNRAWWAIAALTLLLLGLVLYVPALRTLFSLSLLHPLDVAICLCAGLASAAWGTLRGRRATAAPGDGSRDHGRGPVR